ncbi:methyltransferase domain-containing protein [Xylanibacillus composti]|uniref:Methyltransferase domain-containing protein n=1 Tax=Xylanibacillus composti TaxID=1572762 RepID=A0A8J4M353_9BACL|nr:methyltransferase domain-containing protein [Xylanibacillus composti]MDT9726332.1 methyltransferase domain-containing protein [Xylanibacillus composti]GIQ70560.1 hypothetical protein XYCOK13_33840 [Xylanibacillus composti]
MFKNNKGQKLARLLAEHARLFRCPLCAQPMKLVEEKSLVCRSNHCFDLSSRGYINFLTQAHKSKYDKGLFASREMLFRHGAFDPLIAHIGATLAEAVGNDGDHPITLLDAGCGEGSHLAKLQKSIERHTARPALGVGLDIAKDGIVRAAKKSAHALWGVADLANSPLADNTFDIVLNILSPSNYTEFLRVLKDDGMIVKVVPGSTHLQELRERFRKQARREASSNEAVLDHFARHVGLLSVKRMKYKSTLEEEAREALIRMTPLSWEVPQERMQQVLDEQPFEITFDFTILLGKQR